MSRYLVTGATTPVGAALIRELLRDEATTRIVAVGAERVRPITVERDGRVRYLQMDLTRERTLRELVFGPCQKEGVEVVVDMASHRRFPSVGRRAHALNVLATRRLLALAEEPSGIRRLVYRSFAEVHDVSAALPSLVDEAHPLDLRRNAPQWVRDRVEADLTVCSRIGMSELSIAVLRCADCLAPRMGSQLHDYLASRVCLRPMGYDPVMNLLSEEDLSRALALAARSDARGIFMIPGATTLPLSEIIRRSGRLRVPVPGPLMGPLYRVRRGLLGADFDYVMNRGRLHYGTVLDGARARRLLGYEPRVGVGFPYD